MFVLLGVLACTIQFLSNLDRFPLRAKICGVENSHLRVPIVVLYLHLVMLYNALYNTCTFKCEILTFPFFMLINEKYLSNGYAYSFRGGRLWLWMFMAPSQAFESHPFESLR